MGMKAYIIFQGIFFLDTFIGLGGSETAALLLLCYKMEKKIQRKICWVLCVFVLIQKLWYVCSLSCFLCPYTLCESFQWWFHGWRGCGESKKKSEKRGKKYFYDGRDIYICAHIRILLLLLPVQITVHWQYVMVIVTFLHFKFFESKERSKFAGSNGHVLFWLYFPWEYFFIMAFFGEKEGKIKNMYIDAVLLLYPTALFVGLIIGTCHIGMVFGDPFKQEVDKVLA